MKNIIASITLLMIACSCFGQENYKWAVTKQKDFTKTYPIGTAVVSLRNQFGKMEIKHWDKNEVKVEAKILVSTQEDTYASNLLDMVQIVEKINSDTISFKTQIGEENKGWSTNQSNKMSIDYIVYLPAHAKLKAYNSFGSLEIGDHIGEADIQSSHGSLTAGNLTNAKSLKINFEKPELVSLAKPKPISNIPGSILKN